MTAQGSETDPSRSASAAGSAPRRRDRQTRRTRRALLAAADAIFAEGRTPTVADVAERADVARATAYRYFPTQEALLLETTFLGDSEPLRSIPTLADSIPDPAERVAEAVRRGAGVTLASEARLRAVLRVSLDPASGTRRPARRRLYLAQLLDSVQGELSADAYERLTGALTLLFGIDPIVSIKDNSDVAPERIADVLAWTASTLVTAALSQARGDADDRQS